MPKIKLKQNSPEYEDGKTDQIVYRCEMPGCYLEAEHKAPKNRGLDEYFRFCLDHVREYNKAWDFFDGMSEKEVQDHMLNSFYGDRPTWTQTMNAKDAEEILHKKAWQSYHYTEQDPDFENKAKNNSGFRAAPNTPELEAMAIMGLEPPVTLDEIKTRYKTLAKKYHPDINRDNQDAEELLKRINMAYTILKMAFAEYQKFVEE